MGASKTDGLGNDLIDAAEYYVQDARQLVGNCISWWAPKSDGYVCNLEIAGVYRGSHARLMRGTDVPWPVAYVRQNAVTHVRGDTHAFDRRSYKPGPR
jgi:hypothetical protein